MQRRRARALRPGSKVAVVAPAGPAAAEGLAPGLEVLQAWGLTVVPGTWATAQHGYFAGTDRQRAADFNAALRDPTVDAIFCARGGYGSMRIVPCLDFRAARLQPKILLGYSDITALHLAFEREAGWITFHGPMVRELGGRQPWNEAMLLRALTETAPLGEIASPPEGPLVQTIVPGRARGRLAGGNLSLISATLGTPWEIETAGRILVMEDVNEEPYRIDRFLTQLLLAGKLQQCAGIVFGHSPSCEWPENGGPSLSLHDVFKELLVPLGKPLIYGFPCGHTQYKATLPMGACCELDATRGTLTFLEPALVQ